MSKVSTTINIKNVKSVDVVDFTESRCYVIIIHPDDELKRLRFSKKFPFIEIETYKAGHYLFGDSDYPGHIHFSYEEIKRLGYVVHNDKVCVKPKVIVNYIDTTREVYYFDTLEEANKLADEINNQLDKKVHVNQ